MPDPEGTCPRCGAPQDPGDLFCGYCGERLPVEPPTPVEISGPSGLSPYPKTRPPPEPGTPAPPPYPQTRPPPEPGTPAPPPPPPPEPGGREDQTAPAPSAPSKPEPVSGFWARHRGWGLTLLRTALGLLVLYPRNPLMHGDPWLTNDPWAARDPTVSGIEGMEFWGQAMALSDQPDLFYAASLLHIVCGALIVLGLLFRPACLLMAATFLGIWVYLFTYGTSLEIQAAYLATAAAFLGLLVAGPGRLALRRKPKTKG